MDISDFYTFGDKALSSQTLQVQLLGLNAKKDESGLNDRARLIVGDYRGIEFPVSSRQYSGHRLDDMVGTGYPGLYLISSKLRKALEENGFTGWKLFNVRVLDKTGIEIKDCFGLSITGRCGPVDFKKSEIIEKKLVPHGPVCKFYKGLHIGLDQWDGSDFVLPGESFGAVVTCQVQTILKKNKITNIVFENLVDYEIQDFSVNPNK